MGAPPVMSQAETMRVLHGQNSSSRALFFCLLVGLAACDSRLTGKFLTEALLDDVQLADLPVDSVGDLKEADLQLSTEQLAELAGAQSDSCTVHKLQTLHADLAKAVHSPEIWKKWD